MMEWHEDVPRTIKKPAASVFIDFCIALMTESHDL